MKCHYLGSRSIRSPVRLTSMSQHAILKARTSILNMLDPCVPRFNLLKPSLCRLYPLTPNMLRLTRLRLRVLKLGILRSNIRRRTPQATVLQQTMSRTHMNSTVKSQKRPKGNRLPRGKVWRYWLRPSPKALLVHSLITGKASRKMRTGKQRPSRKWARINIGKAKKSVREGYHSRNCHSRSLQSQS